MPMPDPNHTEPVTLQEPGADTPKSGLWMRLVWMIMIAIMISLAQTVLGFITLLQFAIMALSKGEPNERIAEFGTGLGIWIAKAARFQTAGSEVRPWPWTDLD